MEHTYQELVERRVKEADGDREARHGREDGLHVFLLEDEELVEGLLAFFLVLGENHLFVDVFWGFNKWILGAKGPGNAPEWTKQSTYLSNPIDSTWIKEHVLASAQSDALGTQLPGLFGVFRCISVGLTVNGWV